MKGTAFAILDKYPVSPGHTLIIPKIHVSDYFELTFREQSACVFMVNFVKELLQNRFDPAGFNIEINIGKEAGQTIPHAHIHLIPRYAADTPNLDGGVRGVISDKMYYR